MTPTKKCAVCGDKALGYNFNAVTCESCKAFFRRNALTTKQFSCPFNQNCEITVVTRRFCQKCRLKKCLDIGMKSENIMSEEDKMIKRRKIESNREKRRLGDGAKDQQSESEQLCGGGTGVKQEQQAAADSDAYASYDSQSCGSFDSGTGQGSAIGASNLTQPSELSEREVNPDLMTGEEMVEFIVCDPDRACQAISTLMRTPREALFSLEKIINSQKDALRLIEHLIAYPGDALKIISKIMNSPFNALSVFTKFMSSPTDALEVISKVVSSPQDVLLFIKNLMDSPENAIEIMNKFMNTPAEALRMINKILNSTTPALEPTAASTAAATGQEETPEKESNALLNSMLSSSPSGTQSLLPALTAQIAYPPTPESTGAYIVSPPLASPLSVASASDDMQYQSPTTTVSADATDERHRTSMRFVAPPSTSPTHIATEVNALASEHFDLKTAAIHNQNAGFVDNFETINSLDSVLTEVIRIEFQAFNDLPHEPRVKQEYHAQSLSMTTSQQQPQQQQQQQQEQQTKYGGCAAQQQQLQQPICAPSSMHMSRDLNETEQMKLRELRIASEALYYPVDDDLTTLMMGDNRIKPEDTQQDPKLLQVINLTAVAIKRLIKMAKKIRAFRDMCQEDQVALLKGGCTEMMIMRSVMSYDGSRNTWVIPHTKEDMSNIRAEVLKLAKGNVYEEHLKFIRTFDEKWRMDENIILIMCAIVLFMPSRSRIIHSDVIRLEQNTYYYLLRRYLESVYPGCEARSAFIKLIQKISDVERLNQFIIGVYLNVNPAQVEPLLREIFDLKNH